MTRGRYSGGSSQIKGNTSIVNPGDNLQAKYDALVSNGSMGSLSETNRRYMWLTAGTYTDALNVDTKYVHLRVMEGAVLSGAITYTNWYGTAFGTGAGDVRANALNIDLPEALNEYMETTADQAKYIRITENLDFTDMDGISSGATNTGTFDGGNYVLSNFAIKTNPSTKNSNGLFYGNTGTIENITIENGKLTGTSTNPAGTETSYAAFIVAENAQAAYVRNCHVNGDLTHSHNNTTYTIVGLVVGANHGYCHDCSSSGTIGVTATSGTLGQIGGVAGLQTGGGTGESPGEMLRCSSTAIITVLESTFSVAAAYFGGVAGKLTESSSTGTDEIVDCHFDGIVNVDYTYDGEAAAINAGGICGNITGLVSGCSAKGTMIIRAFLTGSGATRCNVGGGVGGGGSTGIVEESWVDIDLQADISEISQPYIGGFGGRIEGTTENCYAKGSIYDLSVNSTALTFGFYGGFMGRVPVASGVITNCYCAIGPYTDTASGVAEGFIGELAGGATATDCYWDSDTCGIVTGASAGAYDDKTTAEMVANATFATWSLNSGGTWKQADLVDYPKLFWEK